jgi:hypothetical protein
MYIPINNPWGGEENISSFDEDEAGYPFIANIRDLTPFFFRLRLTILPEAKILGMTLRGWTDPQIPHTGVQYA